MELDYTIQRKPRALVALAFGVFLLFVVLIGWRTRTVQEQSIALSGPEASTTAAILDKELTASARGPMVLDAAPSPASPSAVAPPPQASVPASKPVSSPRVATTSTIMTASTPKQPQESPKPPAGSWKRAITSVFWVGEGATDDNSYIHNRASAWDEDWQGSFGGVDDPDDRCGYRPCKFMPRENAFYVALPYQEYDNEGDLRSSARRIPWFSEKTWQNGTLLKNRWVAVRNGDRTCYGQWEDVGPYSEDDFAYVFGDAPNPKNKVGLKAGLDVSPAMRDCLGIDGEGVTYWRFIDAALVPSGPWKAAVTGAL